MPYLKGVLLLFIVNAHLSFIILINYYSFNDYFNDYFNLHAHILYIKLLLMLAMRSKMKVMNDNETFTTHKSYNYNTHICCHEKSIDSCQ